MAFHLNRNLLKKTILFAALAVLTACTERDEMPKVVNGHPLNKVPFEQPLLLEQGKEQDFYFYLSGKEQNSEANYMFGIVILFPLDDEKKLEIQHEWDNTDNEDRPLEDNLPFDIKMEYHVQGRIIPVSLKKKFWSSHDKETPQWHRLWLTEYDHSSKTVDGKELFYSRSLLAHFKPASLEPGGFYRVSVKPVPGRQYPDVDFGFFSEKRYIGK